MDAVTQLQDWLNRNSGCVAFLIGGDGKTMAAKALARELLEERKNTKSLPLILLNMGALWPQKDHPSLRILIERTLDHSSREVTSQLGSIIGFEDVLRLHVGEGAFVIFDNPDGALENMSRTEQQLLIGQLMRLVVLRIDGTRKMGKVLITLRDIYTPYSPSGHTWLSGWREFLERPCKLWGLEEQDVNLFRLLPRA